MKLLAVLLAANTFSLVSAAPQGHVGSEDRVQISHDHLAIANSTVLAEKLTMVQRIQADVKKIQSGATPCFDLFECMLMGFGLMAGCDRSGANANFGGIMGTCTDGNGKTGTATTPAPA